MLCLLEQKHLLGWPGQSCLELPGAQQTATAFRVHRQLARRGGSGVMGEGCGCAVHKGVLTEDLGTEMAWRTLEWWWRRSVSNVHVEKLPKGPLQAETVRVRKTLF